MNELYVNIKALKLAEAVCWEAKKKKARINYGMKLNLWKNERNLRMKAKFWNNEWSQVIKQWSIYFLWTEALFFSSKWSFDLKQRMKPSLKIVDKAKFENSEWSIVIKPTSTHFETVNEAVDEI